MYGDQSTYILNYRISSYKALPRIIPAFLIMPAPGTLLCRWSLVISNNTSNWSPFKKIIPAGLIWGNTVFKTSMWIFIPHFSMAEHKIWIRYKSKVNFCYKFLHKFFWIEWHSIFKWNLVFRTFFSALCAKTHLAPLPWLRHLFTILVLHWRLN